MLCATVHSNTRPPHQVLLRRSRLALCRKTHQSDCSPHQKTRVSNSGPLHRGILGVHGIRAYTTSYNITWQCIAFTWSYIRQHCMAVCGVASRYIPTRMAWKQHVTYTYQYALCSHIHAYIPPLIRSLVSAFVRLFSHSLIRSFRQPVVQNGCIDS